MVSFKGKISEPIQKELAIKRNTANGVKGIILSAFLIAPSMFLWLVAISFIKGKDAIITFDYKPVLGGAIALTIVAIITAISSFRKLLFPAKKLPPLDNYEYQSSIDENEAKNTGNFASVAISYKRIKTAYKGDGYFIIYAKKVKAPIILEECCVIEGNFNEVEELLSKKISKKKHTSKEKLEKTNTYSIIGIVCSAILAIATIPLLMLIISTFVSVAMFTVENILIPIATWLFHRCFPFENILENILLGIITLPLLIVSVILIWTPIIIILCGVFFMIYPSILCCSLVFPLKQLTVNKNKLTKFAIIFAIAMILVSIGEIAIYAFLIN